MFTEFYLHINVFIMSFLASTVLPFGSEPLVILYAHTGQLNPFLLLMNTTIGNFLGSITNYYVGYLGHKTIFSRIIKIDRKKLKRAKEVFDKYGNPVLLLTTIPFLGDALTLVAGLVKADIKAFAFFVFVGKFVVYFVMIYSLV